MSLLHIGDIISLYSDGFLSTLGLVDDRCVLQPTKDDDGPVKDPPKKFRDCLFKVCIQHKYDVQGELWRSGHVDEELYKKLYSAAKSEQESNQEKNQLKRGTVVKYEDTIQLLHIKSNKYITVNAKAAAPEEKDATRVYLDSTGNEGSWFKVKSPYKYRSNGEDVVCESIALVSDIMGAIVHDEALYLHASSCCLYDDDESLEINASRQSTSWDIKPFLDYTEDLEDFLKGGDVVRLFHTDQEKFLTMDTYNDDTQHVFLRSTDRAKATSATSSKALWEVEVVQPDPCRSSLARWGSFIRLKHLATERFLAAEQDDDPASDPMRDKLRQKGALVYKLISLEFSYDYATLFEFDSTTMNVNSDDYIPIHSNITLKHFPTSTYVHSTSIYIDKDNKKSCMSKVGCAQNKGLDEVFAVIPVSATEIRDLDFVYDACLLLNEAHDLIRDDSGRFEAHRKLGELLPEIIHFIANKESEPRKIEKALSMSAENPNRERQKLLREQNVLKLLFDILELEDNCEASNNKDICRLCYRVLSLSFQDYRKNQEYIVKWDKFMQNQFGKDIYAEFTYSSLFHSNKNLLEKCVSKEDIDVFVDLIRETRQSNFLDCLSDLCITSNNTVSSKTQRLICESILSDSNRDILISTFVVDGKIMLSTEHWKSRPLVEIGDDLSLACDTKEIPEIQGLEPKALTEIVMASRNGYEIEMFILDYYRHQMDLLSAVCVARQSAAIDRLSVELPMPMIQHCVSDNELPSELRASFCRLLLHLYLNRDPQKLISPVNLRRCWSDIPEKVNVEIYDGAGRSLLLGQFEETMEFVELYLTDLVSISSARTYSSATFSSIFNNSERNKLTFEVINLTRELTYFGFYRLSDFLRLVEILLVLLEDNKNQQQLVMKTKTKIIEILQYMSEVRLDYMITTLLAIFKSNQQPQQQHLAASTGSPQQPANRSTNIGPSEAVPSSRGNICDSTSQIAIKTNQALDQHLNEVNLDSNHGRKFVNILLHLVKHDCPVLVSASLKLLLNYRSQRSRILEKFSKIELLEVASFQIKENFYKLHPLIERSDRYIRKGRDENHLAVNEVLIQDSKLISYIVQHIQYLLKNKDEGELTMDLLRLLKDLIPLESSAATSATAHPNGNKQTKAKNGPQVEFGASLVEVQNKLDAHGASSLLVELIAMGSSMSDEKVRERSAAVFKDTLALGIALLEGGNQLIQASIHNKLTRKSELEKSERFFEVLSNRMNLAQQALSPTSGNPVTTSGSDLSSAGHSKVDGPSAGPRSSRVRRSHLMRPRGDTSSMSLEFSSPRLLRQLSLSATSERLLVNESLKEDLEATIETTGKALAKTRSINNQSSIYLSQDKDFEETFGGGHNELTDSGYSATPTPVGDFQADEAGQLSQASAPPRLGSRHPRGQLPDVIRIMHPILRFLQLLCEDHNLTMQNYIHSQQQNKLSYNLVAKSLVFLNCLCGSKEGSLGHKLGEYIKENNVDLINQTLRTLTEYCQGPCIENQHCILMHESNGIDMIRSLILDNIEPLDNLRMDLVLELKDNASKLLLALMESCSDPQHARRILREASATRKLINVSIAYYHEQDDYDDSFAELSGVDESLAGAGSAGPTTRAAPSSDGMVRPRDVGHKVFILCHQLVQQFNLVVQQTGAGQSSGAVPIQVAAAANNNLGHHLHQHHHQSLHNTLRLAKIPTSDEARLQAGKSGDSAERESRLREATALRYYESHTAQIEIVRGNRELERVVFPVPQICEYLTDETKTSVYHNTEQDERGSKIPNFFQLVDDLFGEMRWQRELQTKPILHSIARYMSLWSDVEFKLSFLVTVLVVFCVSKSTGEGARANCAGQLQQQQQQQPASFLPSLLSTLLAIACSTFFVFKPRIPHSWNLFLVCSTLYLVQVVGQCVSLKILGLFLEAVTVMHLFSVLINKGIVNKPAGQILLEWEVAYHGSYLLGCSLGLLVSPLFYPWLLPQSLIRREETLRNVIKSVTKNAYSILMTGFLGLIIILLYAIATYLYLPEDLVLELADGDSYKPCAGSLFECYVAYVNYGLRAGGGIGEHIRDVQFDPSPIKLCRLFLVLSFFLIVNLLLLQIVYCVIVDSFATLRSEKQQKDEILRNSCFVCGLNRSSFENRSVTFEDHIQIEHNLWHYLYFIVLIKTKSRTELSGPESYVNDLIKANDNSWFPRMRAISLAAE